MPQHNRDDARDDARAKRREEHQRDLAKRLGLPEDVIRAALELGVDEENIEEAYEGQYESDDAFLKDLMKNYINQDGHYFRDI